MNKRYRKQPMRARTIASVVAALFEASYASSLLANPTGAQVVAGSVNVNSPTAGQMNITQGTQNAIVNWNTFSIGAGESVTVAQPSASAALLNRVVGNDPSTIAGRLQANGKVFLVNPAGVIFSPGSSVNVGSLVASTLNISDADFLAGNYHFVGASPAGVSNAGSLAAQQGGTIALLGGTVSNSGTVTAKLGTVALGAGSDISLDFAGDGLTTLTINSAAAQALVGNTGTLAADGGLVVMSAQTADALASSVVNQQGIVRAQSLAERNGHIVLDGGSNGTTTVSGTLDATGGAGLSGGRIDATGRDVALLAGANVDASGAVGGGTVNLGGGAGGQDPAIRNADTLSIDPAAQVHADALTNGNGGSVSAYSDTSGLLYGTLTAKGGPQGGNGGTVETSSHYLDLLGSTIDVSAPAGNGGMWKIDPYEMNITDNPNETVPTGGSLVLTSEIEQSLNQGARVIVDAASTDPGSINVESPISMTGARPASLTLMASGSISVEPNANITSTGGALDLTLNAAIGADPTAGSVSINAATIDTNGGAFTINAANSGGQSPVSIMDSTISTGAGAITINGNATTGGAIALGYNTLLATTTGNVTLTGVAQQGDGVDIESSAVQTANGAIQISGAGTAFEPTAYGVYATGGYTPAGSDTASVPVLGATGTGSISVTGTATGNSATGVELDGATVSAASGGVTINGTANAANVGNGVSLSDAAIDTASGNVSITGTATNQQVAVGYALSTTANGIALGYSSVASIDGDLALNGSTQVMGDGVRMLQATLQTTGSGSIAVTGNANVPDSTALQTGVDVAGTTVSASGTGSIALTGDANGESSDGVVVIDATIQGAAGAISVNGSATATANGGNAAGVAVQESALNSTTGAINVTGAALAGADGLTYSGDGVTMYYGSIGTMSGNISVTGTATGANSGASFSNADGVAVQSSYGQQSAGTAGMAFSSTAGGSIDIEGSAQGQYVIGVGLDSAGISATTGPITVHGSADTTISGEGVDTDIALLTSTSGAITVNGSANASDAGTGRGVELGYTSLTTTSGGVNVTGTVTGTPGQATGATIGAGYTPQQEEEGGPLTEAVAGDPPSVQTDSGNITIAGSAPATAQGSNALSLFSASIVSNSGAIGLTGTTTGTPIPGTSSTGVLLNGSNGDGFTNTSITTGSGALTIEGSGSGQQAAGVAIANATTITSTNGGAIDIRGVATSPTTSTAGGNIQYDYGTLIEDGSITSTMAGSTISIAGSTNTSDAGVAIGAVPIPSDQSVFFNTPYETGPVTISGAPGGTLTLRAANDNTSQSLLARGATITGGGGTLAISSASVDPATFALSSQDAPPITLFGTSGGMSIDAQTFAAFSQFGSLTLGSSTQTGLITVNGQCASASSSCQPVKPTLDMNLTLANAGAGSQGIQLPYGLDVGNHTLTLQSAGNVTDPGGIDAAQLVLAGPGTFTLTDPQNNVGEIAFENAGNVDFSNPVGFVIGGGNSTLTGNLVAQATTGNISLGSTAAGGPTTNLSAGGTIDLVMENGVFVSPDGGTVSATNGWRIWASTWSGETRGNVQPNTSQPNFYGCTFGAGCSWGGTVPSSGDHYVYVARPTVTVTADGETRVVGAPDPAFTYAVSGLINGDTAAGTLSGTLTSPATPGSPAGRYAIDPAFLSSVGYIVNDVPGTLTVTAAPTSTQSLAPRFAEDLPMQVGAQQSYFGNEEKTFVYENNLQGTNICVGSSEPLFTTAPPGDNQDLLAVEWRRVRSQPNLNSCLLLNSQHGCGDF